MTTFFFLTQEAKESAITRADNLQNQLNKLHEDHEKLRKAHLKHLQEKVCSMLDL